MARGDQMSDASQAPGPPGPGRRPLLLLHLMALVAAVALTIVVPPAFMRAVMRSYGPESSWNRFMYLDGVTTLALTSWTVLLAPLVLVANRSQLQESGRSYGTSALFAAASALSFFIGATAFEKVSTWMISGWPIEWFTIAPYLQMLGGILWMIPHVAAAAIVAAWSILALSGVGRRPSSWPEILCLILGLCWIAWWGARGGAPPWGGGGGPPRRRDPTYVLNGTVSECRTRGTLLRYVRRHEFRYS